jgi:hypothetical protein
MKVYAILRATRSHTEFHGVCATREYADLKVFRLNEIYPRGARFSVSAVIVETDPNDC